MCQVQVRQLEFCNYAIGESFDYNTFLKLFKSIQKLGEGGYGYVYLGRHILSNEQYAIKLMMPG